MVKVYLPSDSKMSMGGGWRFRENLTKGAESIEDMTVVDTLKEADISLIAGATMVLPPTFTKLKEQGKVVLRLDGVPEAWRNEGRTWGRFKNYFKESDGIVYQSPFVENTTGRWLKMNLGLGDLARSDGVEEDIIMNGVDKSIFKEEGDKIEYVGKYVILNINSRKDENKRIEEVIARYRRLKLRQQDLFLLLLGKYPTYLIENNFGLYDYEVRKDWLYLGMKEDKEEIAKVMRSCDEFWFPSFADPCPNVLIEALHCGCRIRFANTFGGSKDILTFFKDRYDFGLEAMAKHYYDFFKKVLSVKK